MAFDAVIFDCDGVLVDSEVISIRTEVQALAAVGIELRFTDVVDRYVGRSDASMSAAITEEFGVELDEAFWTRLRARTHLALAAEVQPVPGIPELVAELSIPYCLASSSSHERVGISLSAAGLLPLFADHIRFSGDDVQRGKPAPDLFIHAARGLGVDPAGCVVVEDSPFGVQAALAAGMQPIGFVGGSHADVAWARRLEEAGADVVADDVADLGRVLGT